MAEWSQLLVARGRPSQSDMLRWVTLLRDRPEFQAAMLDETWFVRIEVSAAKDASRILSLLPCSELFELDQQQRLTPVGKTVPTDILPAGLEWKPLHQLVRLWLPASHPPSKNVRFSHPPSGRVERSEGRVEVPAPFVQVTSSSSAPGRPSQREGDFVSLRWRPSEQLSAPGALLCSFADWSSFVLKNLQPKWRSLRFACRRTNEQVFDTLVVGSPMPSIPGTRLVNCERILTPVAFTWSPAVPAQAIRNRLEVTESDWILWREEASLEIVSNGDLIPTTRVSIRATAHALSDAIP